MIGDGTVYNNKHNIMSGKFFSFLFSNCRGAIAQNLN